MHRVLIVTPAVNPHFLVFLPAVSFRHKIRPTHFRISKLSQEHFCGFPEFPNPNLRQISPGVLSYDLTNKQTDRQTTRDYNFISIDLEKKFFQKTLQCFIISYQCFIISYFIILIRNVINCKFSNKY